MDQAKMKELTYLIEGLVIFRYLQEEPVVQTLKSLLTAITSEELVLGDVYLRYHQFSALAVERKWPTCLWESILHSENELTRQLNTRGRDGISQSLGEIALRDLAICHRIAQITLSELKEVIVGEIPRRKLATIAPWNEGYLAPENWPTWQGEAPANRNEEVAGRENLAEGYRKMAQERVIRALGGGNSPEMLGELLAYYQSMGTGIFSFSTAYKWQGQEGTLLPVPADPSRREYLIGQEREQRIILENTEFFLSGFAANNIILYGDRGTGKSTLVKALLQEYCSRGLRLVEIAKNELRDLGKLLFLLGRQHLKFIIFIDDLSFEETETEFKTLKTLLEGGLVGKPANVLIYATSNRRHLVKETFSERQVDEVNRRDLMQEKLSLADRFGITVTFATPDQEGYLQIVEELAAIEGIFLDRDLLRQQALQWVMRHNARSGRTARQFIDYLKASQSLGE